ncbi:hypothetical protein [Vibrio mexicanus]|uniref:hypothetical protein n=1 Tax=Vibrio mexicanus TaxID=1004326 RepID=UPI00063C10AF|nr:hypothetical protein [Vibrio mexicanus]
MFKCPNCGESISIIKKVSLHPRKQSFCAKCSQQLKISQVYYYSTFFVGALTVSLSMGYGDFGFVSAVILGMFVNWLILTFQPIKKPLL